MHLNSVNRKYIYYHNRRRSNVLWGCKIFILLKSNQICHNLNHFCPNLTTILSNLINFAPKKFARGCGCIPNAYGTVQYIAANSQKFQRIEKSAQWLEGSLSLKTEPLA